MKNKFQILALMTIIFLVGCPNGNPPSSSSAGKPPANFAGTWSLTESEAPTDPKVKPRTILVTLNPSKAGTPSTKGGVFMDGKYDQNGIIQGTATDDFFVGTITVPKLVSSAASITMQIVKPGSAVTFIRDKPYNAKKRIH